jgi:hypothetical protein
MDCHRPDTFVELPFSIDFPSFLRPMQVRSWEENGRMKNRSGEEGRRFFSECFEENPGEEDPVSNRQFCIHSISALTFPVTLNTFWGRKCPKPVPEPSC